jgi:hypothetical protein
MSQAGSGTEHMYIAVKGPVLVVAMDTDNLGKLQACVNGAAAPLAPSICYHSAVTPMNNTSVLVRLAP